MSTITHRSAIEDLTAAGIARRGADLYERELRDKIEAGNVGKFLVLDILSGRYVIADDDATATLRLLEQAPEAITYGVRVGAGEAYLLGSTLDPRCCRPDGESAMSGGRLTVFLLPDAHTCGDGVRTLTQYGLPSKGLQIRRW